MKEKKILAVDGKTAALVNESVKEVQTLLQTTVKGFKALEIGELETIEQLLEVTKAPETFIKTRMIDLSGGLVAVAGLTLNRKKLMDLMELPPKAIDFIKLLSSVFNEIDDITARCKKETGINIFKFFIEAEKVQTTDELKEIAQRAGVTYAENENQIIAFNKVKEIIKLMEEIHRLQGTEPTGQRFLNLDVYLRVDPNNYTLVPNHHVILERVK
jgi:hypothetical protein